MSLRNEGLSVMVSRQPDVSDRDPADALTEERRRETQRAVDRGALSRSGRQELDVLPEGEPACQIAVGLALEQEDVRAVVRQSVTVGVARRARVLEAREDRTSRRHRAQGAKLATRAGRSPTRGQE